MISDLTDGVGVVALVNGLAQSYGAVDMALHILSILRAGQHGQQLPPNPPATDPEQVANAIDYAGAYGSGAERLVVTASGERLSLRWRGSEVALQQRGMDSFYVSHPELEHSLLEFGRDEGRVVEAFHGANWYTGERYSGPARFDYPEEWDGFCGHYRAYNFGLTNFRVVVRKGALLLLYPTGGHEPLVPVGDGAFRIGKDPRSPETIRFDSLASGKALRAVYSGCPYYRTYTP